MLTPQEVSTHSFAKASFGGYNMAMVDEFLDELTDDYTALYKENAALKAKLKVLVEKRDQMMTQAEIDAKLRINCLKNEAAAAEERLRKGKEELEKFSAAVRAVCDKEIQLLNELPQAPVELPQEEAKPEDSVQEIEDSVMAAFSEAAPEEDGDTAETQTEASEPVAEAADPAADTSDPFGDFPDLSSTRQINLDELKFGRNYNT